MENQEVQKKQKDQLVISQKSQKKTSKGEFYNNGNLSEGEKGELIKNWAERQSRFSFKPVIAKTVNQKKYLDSVVKKEVVTLDSMLKVATAKETRNHKKPKQKMAYEDAKVLLWRIIQTKLESQGRKFEYAGNDLEVIVELLKYFIADDSGVLDLRKGICISGSVGMGKTFLMECFMTFTKVAKLQTFGKIGCGDIYDKLEISSKSKNGSAALAMSSFYKGNLFFDDLGTEPVIFKDYGNDIRYIERIFFKREESFRNGLCISHITTNLDKEALENRYGKRFFDRFKQMFNLVTMTSPSKRR